MSRMFFRSRRLWFGILFSFLVLSSIVLFSFPFRSTEFDSVLCLGDVSESSLVRELVAEIRSLATENRNGVITTSETQVSITERSVSFLRLLKSKDREEFFSSIAIWKSVNSIINLSWFVSNFSRAPPQV